MTSDKNKSLLKRISGIVFPLALTAVFLWFAFRSIDFSVMFEHLSNISVFWAIVFIIVFLMSHYARALRWKVMISSVKPDASSMVLWGALMIGYGVNCVVPRLGELYRALFLGKWEGLSRTSMLGTIIVERVIDVAALIISVLISVWIYGGNLYDDVLWLKSSMYIVLFAVVFMLLFFILLIRYGENFYGVIVNFVSRFSARLAEKLGYIFKMLVQGFSSLRGTKNYIYTIFLSALIMFFYGLNSYIGFYMMSMDDIMPVTFGMGWILMTMSAFGVVLPTPGGTGSYHAITILVLVNIFGFAREISGAYALTTHLISYIMFLGAMFISFYLGNIRQKRIGKKSENFLSVFKINPDQ